MIMYHGTSSKNINSIMREQSLSINNNANWSNTTKGYLYLSNDIVKAMFYGNKSCEEGDSILLFKFDILYSELLPDFDEMKCQSVTLDDTPYSSYLDMSLYLCKSARVNYSIHFNKYDVQYCKIERQRDEYDDLVLVHNSYEETFKKVITAVNCEFSIGHTFSQKEFISNIVWKDFRASKSVNEFYIC